MDWAALKTVITEGTGLSRDALHLIAGAGGYLVLAALLPRRASPWLAWFAILLAGVANEWADYLHETWPGQWKETAKDMVTTLAFPTLILFLARFAPRLLVRPADGDDLEEQAARADFSA